MPLRKGKSWRYIMYQAAEVVEAKCTSETLVGESMGWRIEGPAGSSIMAWDGCILRASKLGSMTFEPPIGILQGGKTQANWRYEGKARAKLKPGKVVVTLHQEPVDLNGENALKVTLKAELDGNKIELVTTFRRGVGIADQQQRNDGRVVSSIKLLNDRG
jgi:hypothetical protein